MFQVIVNFEHVMADWETTGTTKIQNTYKFSLFIKGFYIFVNPLSSRLINVKSKQNNIETATN